MITLTPKLSQYSERPGSKGQRAFAFINTNLGVNSFLFVNPMLKNLIFCSCLNGLKHTPGKDGTKAKKSTAIKPWTFSIL